MKKFDFLAFFFLFFLCSFLTMKEELTNLAGLKMQEFVINSSIYAKKLKPNFIIIPQNGLELGFTQLDPNNPVNLSYSDAIDGYGIEELFYNANSKVDSYKIKMVKVLKSNKPILVSENIKVSEAIPAILARNKSEGFLCFARSSSNYDYKEIPRAIPDENANDILQLSDAQNYLYLINSASYKTRDSFLNAIALTNYDLLIIDLFYDNMPFSADEIQLLKTKANGGKRLVLSYLNIGSAENWRYYWRKNWKLNSPTWLLKKYAGYDNEIYVQFWNPEWQKIIYGNDTSYLKKIINAGFDGAYIDNVEAYYFLYNN